MSRALTVLIAAGAMLAGVEPASAQYYAPVDYHDAPPRYYEEPYEGYDAPPYYADPYYDERRAPYLRDRGYRDRPRYYDDPGYYDEPGYGAYYPPERRGYYDDDAEDALLPPDDSAPAEAQGFDPRRPHLGDGTDAPSEQYYSHRPRSCGEYYYWDGQACVDARHYPPYVGPKP